MLSTRSLFEEIRANDDAFRLLTGAGADAFGHASLKTPELARSTLFSACVCDGAGAPLFTIKDAPRIAELPNRVLSPVVDAIIDHTVGRVLDLFGLETDLVQRWNGLGKP